MNAPAENLETQIRNSFPDLRNELDALYKQMASLAGSERVAVEACMGRYYKEGLAVSYRADATDLLALIEDEKLIDSATTVIDFGAGAGQLVSNLATLYPASNFIIINKDGGQ